jgi:hypothetical protein
LVWRIVDVEKLRKALEKKAAEFSEEQAEKRRVRQGCGEFFLARGIMERLLQNLLGHLRAAWKTRINCTTSPRTR